MTTVHDVRVALWEAYQQWGEITGRVSKMTDGIVEVVYAPVLGDDRPAGDADIKAIYVDSCALGPFCVHQFIRRPHEAYDGHTTWASPDPAATAVRVIGEWVKLLEATQ